jgi:hypothetical protein
MAVDYKLTDLENAEVRKLIKELGIDLTDKIIFDVRRDTAIRRLRAIYENAIERELHLPTKSSELK